MQQGDVSVLSPITFHGWHTPSAKEAKTIKPEDFLREVKSRKTNYMWTDAKTISHAAAQFRDEAAEWYEDTVPIHYKPAEYQLITTVWLNFKRAFKKEYFKQKIRRLDWTSLASQNQGETVTAYYNRVSGKVNKYFTNLVDEKDPIVVPAGEASLEALDEANLTQVQRAAVMDVIANECLRTSRLARADNQRDNTMELIRKMVVNGLRNPQFRTFANNLEIDSTIEFQDLFDRLKVSAELPDYKNNGSNNQRNHHSNGNGNGRHRVHEIAEEEATEEIQDSPDVVDAVQKAPRGGHRGRGKPRGSSSAAARPKQQLKQTQQQQQQQQGVMRRCTWCNIFGHDEINCNKKKNYMNAQNTQTLRAAAIRPEQDCQVAQVPWQTLRTAAIRQDHSDSVQDCHAPYAPCGPQHSGNANGAWNL